MKIILSFAFSLSLFATPYGFAIAQSIILSNEEGIGELGGLTFRDGDLVEYFIDTGQADLYFSEDLLTGTLPDIDAVHVSPDGIITLSTQDTATLAGVTFEDGDLVEYNPVTQEANIILIEDAVFDSISPDIDAIYVRANGNIILSTATDVQIGGIIARDGDLVEYNPTTDVATRFFDEDLFGRVGMPPGTALNPDIDAVHILVNGDVVLSTRSSHSLPGLERFEGGDLVVFDPDSQTAQIFLAEADLVGAMQVSIDAVHVNEVDETADLAITKTDSADPVAVGENLTYTLTVTNNGPSAAPGVVVVDTLPASLSLISATPSQGICSGTSPLTCNLGTLNSGANVSINIDVMPTSADTLSNFASVSAGLADPNSDNNLATQETTVLSATNSCAGDHVIIQNTTYGAGEFVVCWAFGSITTQAMVWVRQGAHVTFMAPEIVLKPDFRVEAGGIFRASSVSGTSEGLSALPKTTKIQSSGLRATHQEPVAPPARWLTLEELPLALKELLAEKESLVGDIATDADGHYIAFAADAALLDEDTNSVWDIYLYDTWTAYLHLVSRALNRGSANGASTCPRIDGEGEHIVYQSQADNLVDHDHNRVSDIFLYNIASGVIERVSWGLNKQESDRPAQNPAIGGMGPRLLYDRVGEEGHRQIYGIDRGWSEPLTEQLSFPTDEEGRSLDSHHPGISGNGRYITYLETMADERASCAVHVYDTTTEAYAQVTCPLGMNANSEVLPFFSEDAGTIEWVAHSQEGATALLSEQISPGVYRMDNPLAAAQ